jgi:hypothetical protein
MHFSGPPHFSEQAIIMIVLRSGLELCLQAVHEAYQALATSGVGCERHGEELPVGLDDQRDLT